MEKEQTLVYLSSELKTQARHRAIDERTSLSELVERALEQYLTRHGREKGEKK